MKSGQNRYMSEIKVISSNIRFDNPKDGQHIWQNRIEILSSIINSKKPDYLGTQEGWRRQLYQFYTKLENLVMVDDHRSWIEDRMYPTIFINPDTFEKIKSGDIWLSETPNVPASKSFDSAFPRLCSWAKVKHKKSGENLLLVNVHLDHLETKTRQSQIKVLIEEISKIHNDNEKVIIIGDFNEGPDEEVRKIIDQSEFNLKDPWLELKQPEESSHHKFTGINPNGTRIDWILRPTCLECIEINLIKDHENNIYPSDHFPVEALFRL